KPEFPPPSIVDYKPRSTLVTPQHPVPRARFPVVDIHSHQPTPMPADAFEKVVAAMDELNLKVLVNLSGSTGDRLAKGIEPSRPPCPSRSISRTNAGSSSRCMPTAGTRPVCASKS